jgi:DNA mismatch repair ATPase MutS
MMKTFLLHRNRDVDPNLALPPNEKTLTQDLEIMFNAMAGDDPFLFEVAKNTVLGSNNNDIDTIKYRQNVLKDCLKNVSIVTDIYNIAVESMENKKGHYYSFFSRYPSSILSGSIEMMQMFVELFKKLKKIAEDHLDKFDSDGFTAFFAMINKELDYAYLNRVQDHLKELKFRDGVLISAELGKGNEGTRFVLRKENEPEQGWIKRIFKKKSVVYTYSVHPRDEAGSRALSELKDQGIDLAANALAQSADHVNSFFKMLRTELAFYIGCLNLYENLSKMGAPVSFPSPVAQNKRQHAFHELYDVCLALTMKQKIMGNDGSADGKDLVIITGANQGGKSTFLRSIGLAQLMMQCGMFVPAQAFCSNICTNLFTHYRREEDISMESGKLDEELGRMNDIVNHITPDSMVLFNESFSATNEREGSEIARQITSALTEKHIKVFFVTHLYEFPIDFYDRKFENTLFLRAERRADGKRTFKIAAGEPLQTGYGKDLYYQIFQTEG